MPKKKEMIREVVSRGAYRLAWRFSPGKLFLSLDSKDQEEVRADAEFCYSVLGYLKLCRIPVSFENPSEFWGVPGVIVVECEEFFPRVCVWGISTQKGFEILPTPAVTIGGTISPQEWEEEIVALSKEIFVVLRNFLRVKIGSQNSRYILASVSFNLGFWTCCDGDKELGRLLLVVGAIGPEDISLLKRTEKGIVKTTREELISLLREKF